jgi:hypothetical protein
MSQKIIIAADWEPNGWRVFVYDPFGTHSSPSFCPSGHRPVVPKILSNSWDPSLEIPCVYELSGFLDRGVFLDSATYPNLPTELLIESAHLWERTPASLAQVFVYDELVILEDIARMMNNLTVVEFPHSLAKRARLECGFGDPQKDMDPQAQALFRLRRPSIPMRELNTSHAINTARPLTVDQSRIQAKRDYRAQIVRECNQRLNIMRRYGYGNSTPSSFFQEHIDAMDDVAHMLRIVQSTYDPAAGPVSARYPSATNMERYAGMKYFGPRSPNPGTVKVVSANTCMSVYVAVRHRQAVGGLREVRKSPNGTDNIGVDTVWSQIFNMSAYHGGIGGIARANLMHYNLAKKSRFGTTSVVPFPMAGGNPLTSEYLARQTSRKEFRTTIKGLIRLFRDSKVS